LSNTAWQVTQSFGRLSSDVHIAMQGISDALAINDGQRALEIAAIGIKSIWWEFGHQSKRRQWECGTLLLTLLPRHSTT